MHRPEGIQKSFIRADTVLNQYQLFLIFRAYRAIKSLTVLFFMAFSLSGLLVLHGHDMAVRAELHIERALRTVKHRIPLDLDQILHGLAAVRTGRIFRVLHPVAKAADGVHILAGRTVKQGHRRFAQHKGDFR